MKHWNNGVSFALNHKTIAQPTLPNKLYEHSRGCKVLSSKVSKDNDYLHKTTGWKARMCVYRLPSVLPAQIGKREVTSYMDIYVSDSAPLLCSAVIGQTRRP